MSLWRNLIGPSQQEVWEQLAALIGGELTPRTIFKGPVLRTRVGVWTLTLDSIGGTNKTPPYTRLRAPYVNPEGFRFHVYRAGLFTGLAKAFGGQDVVIGDPEFDEAYVVKATNENRIRDLLTREIRERLMEHAELYLEVKDHEGWFGPEFPDGVDELYLALPGIVKDRVLLRDAFDLFAITLDALCKLGSAYQERPPLKL